MPDLEDDIKSAIELEKKKLNSNNVWNYSIFVLSAIVAAGMLASLLVLETPGATIGWLMAIYWMLVSVKMRKEKIMFWQLWVHTMESALTLTQEHSKESESEKK